MNRRLLIFFVTLALTSASAPAQASQTGAASTEMRAAANDAYQKQDWAAAAAAYEKIVKLEGQNPNARYRLGLSLLNLKQNAEALVHLEASMSISPNPVFAMAVARAYARTGKTEKVYETIEKSLTLGGIAPESLTSETDFFAIKTEPRFVELVKKSDLAVHPCKAKSEFRQFDFWIGEWLPKNPQGVTVGTSSIQLILGDCVVFENWSTPVSSGKSFNVFDVRDGKWHQTWVDNKGLITHYVGGLVDGKMILVANTIVNGQKTLAKMTFAKLENGDVRQHGENSTDNGKTWNTTFDFIYVRKQ